MWIARFKVWHQSIIAPFTEGLEVTATVYYLNFFKKGRKYFHNKVVVFTGAEWQKAVKRLVKGFKEELLEVDENKCFFRVPELKAFHNAVLSSGVFLTQPIIFKNGWQYWEVASNDKKAIQSVYNKIKRLKGKTEIISLKKTKHIEFAAEPFVNRLSEKQSEAFLLAFENGYYSVPREKTLEEIALQVGVPYTTFRERLQRAESTLMKCIASP